MAKPILPRWADTNASFVAEPSTGKKDTGWLSGEKPPFQFMNWLFLKNYEWIEWFNAKTKSLGQISLETADPVVWESGALTLNNDLEVKFREEAGDFRINKIAAGTINIGANQVLVIRPDRVAASPVTLALQGTYSSLADGEYGVFNMSQLDLNNDEKEVLLFVRRDVTRGALGTKQVLITLPYGTKHFEGETFDFGNSGDLAGSYDTTPSTRNVALQLSVGGVLSVTQEGGQAFSSNYYGKFMVKSTINPELYVPIRMKAGLSFQDSNGASDLAAQYWGLTAGIAYSFPRPIFAYIFNKGDNDVDGTNAGSLVGFSFNSQLTQSPAAAGIAWKGNPASVLNDSNVFFPIGVDVTGSHAALPCEKIGSFRIQKTGGNDMTVETLALQDGIGKYQEGKWFNFPTSQFGATADYFITANPFMAEFLGEYYGFQHDHLTGRDIIEMEVVNDGGQDGTANEAVRMTLPHYPHQNAKSSMPLDMGVIASGSGLAPSEDCLPLIWSATLPEIFFYRNNIGDVLKANVFGAGSRALRVAGSIKVF